MGSREGKGNFKSLVSQKSVSCVEPHSGRHTWARIIPGQELINIELSSDTYLYSSTTISRFRKIVRSESRRNCEVFCCCCSSCMLFLASLRQGPQLGINAQHLLFSTHFILSLCTDEHLFTRCYFIPFPLHQDRVVVLGAIFSEHWNFHTHLSGCFAIIHSFQVHWGEGQGGENRGKNFHAHQLQISVDLFFTHTQSAVNNSPSNSAW